MAKRAGFVPSDVYYADNNSNVGSLGTLVMHHVCCTWNCCSTINTCMKACCAMMIVWVVVCSPDVLLGTGQFNMPRAEARPLTEAQSPALATRHRAAHQQIKQADQQQPDAAQPAFKAHPLNKKILDGPVSLLLGC